MQSTWYRLPGQKPVTIVTDEDMTLFLGFKALKQTAHRLEEIEGSFFGEKLPVKRGSKRSCLTAA